MNHSASPQHSERELILEAILRTRNIEVPEDLDQLRRYAEDLQTADKEVEDVYNSRLTEEATVTNDAFAKDSEKASIVVDHVLSPQTYVHDQGKTCKSLGDPAFVK